MANADEIEDAAEQSGSAEVMEIDNESAATSDPQPRALLYNLPIPPLIAHPSFHDLETALHAFSKQHGFELVIRRTKGNPIRKRYYSCKRHGKLDNRRRLTEESRVRKKIVSIKTECPFKLVATAMKDTDGFWKLNSVGHGSEVHNHPADHSLQLTGHRRRDRTDAVKASIISMHLCEVKPAKIHEVLKEQYGDGISIVLQDIKNVMSSHRAERLNRRVSEHAASGTSVDIGG